MLSPPLYALHMPVHRHYTPKYVTSISCLPILKLQMGMHQQPALHTASVKVGVTSMA